MSAHLNLTVVTSEELEQSRRPVPAEITGPVPAVATHDREAFSCSLWIPEVAVGEAVASDPEFAGHPVRTVPPSTVDHPERLPAERGSIGHARPSVDAVGDRVEVRPDTCFGCAAHSDQLSVWSRVCEAISQVKWHPVAGHKSGPQT